MKNLLFVFISLSILIACSSQKEEYPTVSSPLSSSYDPDLKPFYHGVASGDPLQDAVVIWTKVTPEDSLPSIDVEWELSTTESFEEITANGSFTTDPSRDYTVKVDVMGLDPGTRYFYRFKALDAVSMTGITKTASTQADELKFAVVSCSNFEWGYFNAYGSIAEIPDLDAVLHLGDYIYEYAPGGYGDTTIGRKHLPAKELITLYDYRTRYSQYRLDKDLRNAHASHPFINIWDDHEIANNAYVTGAQNHQEDEGPYEVRKSDAVRAFYEWLPAREGGKHYRSFDYGELAEVIMLDERLEGRTRQADSLTDPSLQDVNRTLLGSQQMEWFKERLTNSRAQWKVVGNQVIYSYLNWGYEPDFTINLDSWDGYPIDQEEVAEHIVNGEIENVVFVTGDTHSSWAFEVSIDPHDFYDPETGEGAFAVEFGATSINSANANERFSTDTVKIHEATITDSPLNPHLKYSNLRDHGYLLITLSKEKAQADFIFVPTLREQSTETYTEKTLIVNSGSTRLVEPGN